MLNLFFFVLGINTDMRLGKSIKPCETFSFTGMLTDLDVYGEVILFQHYDAELPVSISVRVLAEYVKKAVFPVLNNMNSLRLLLGNFFTRYNKPKKQ